MKINYKEKFSLKKKNILITGGSGFLGKYFTQALLSMDAKVLILDKKINKSFFKKEFKTFIQQKLLYFYEADIKRSIDIKKIIAKILKENKKIDILINAASLAMPSLLKSKTNHFAPFEDYSLNLWNESLKINLTGTFLITKEVGKFMLKVNNGVIINIAADVGVISPDHRIYQPNKLYNYKGVKFNTPPPYSISKSGVISLTRYLATYWAKKGIRVNSISPSGVFNNQDPKFIEQLSRTIPMGRMAYPEEICGPLIFLCSEASSFITGANLIVDGGRTVW